MALIVGSLAAGLLDDGDNGNGNGNGPDVIIPTGPTGPGNGGTTGSTPPPTVEGCRIRTGPLVTLKEQPGTFSQDAGRVPQGEYTVEATQTVTFGPETQRWLRITADGRTGWIEDSTFNIESKSADCP